MKLVTLAVLLLAPLFACSPAPAACKCASGFACVYVGASPDPTCALACRDAGVCTSGLSCVCAASCQGCKDCVAVCQ